MWAFLSVIVVCATVLVWSYRYITPYTSADDKPLETDVKVDNESKLPSFDEVIQKIYNKLEE